MPATHLKIYCGPSEAESQASEETGSERNDISVALGDILPLLCDAVSSQRTWLSDFEDDEITISSDLYEVLLAYQHFRRPSA